jgi:hypothetical protein
MAGGVTQDEGPEFKPQYRKKKKKKKIQIIWKTHFDCIIFKFSFHFTNYIQ